MASRPSWGGALELGGFPVHVSITNRVKSTRSESFRMLDGKGQPVRRVYLDSDGNEIAQNECARGIEVSKGEYVLLTPKALEAISKAERSTIVEPEAFCPMDSIDLATAQGSYEVTPDSKAAGAEKSANVLWNGLRKSKLAYVSKVTMRSGSKDSILAFYATDEGLFAVALPYEADLKEPSGYEWTVDKKAEAVFEQFVNASYDKIVGPFERGRFQSEHSKRREDAITAVLANKPVPAQPEPAKPDSADLMATLEAAVKEVKPKAKKAPAKKSTRKKVAA